MSPDAVQEPSVIAPKGNLAIDKVEALRNSILEAWGRSLPVVIDLGGVEDIDLSSLQVLYAAKRQALGTGTGFSLSGNLSGRLRERLRRCGFVLGTPMTGTELEAALVGYRGVEA